MMNVTSDDYFSKLVKLMNELNPHLMLIEQMIGELAIINSPYKNEFVFLRKQGKLKKINQGHNFEYEISLVIREIDQFGKLLETILSDEKVSDLYISTGIVDKLAVLINDISKTIKDFSIV
jgi:hypothetical protein